jgi:hypothetical protein
MRSLRLLAPVALVGALGLAACGDQDASEAAAPSYRDASAAEQARYVDLQRDRAAAARASSSPEAAFREALAAEEARYVDFQRDRAAAARPGSATTSPDTTAATDAEDG